MMIVCIEIDKLSRFGVSENHTNDQSKVAVRLGIVFRNILCDVLTIC